jgi:hypothetical protein
VYVHEGGYKVRGERASGYPGIIVSVLDGEQFKVKSILSNSVRTEYSYNIYKSMEESPEVTSRKPAKLSEVLKEESLKKKIKHLEIKNDKERAKYDRKVTNLKRSYTTTLMNKDFKNEQIEAELVEATLKLKDSTQLNQEYKVKIDQMLTASRKQHAIVSALFHGEECDEANLEINQGGNRIVERYRALFEAGKNSTTEKRLENTVIELKSKIQNLELELVAASKEQEKLRKSKNQSADEKRKANNKLAATQRSRDKHAENHHRVNKLLKVANRELKEAKDSLAHAEVNALKWEQIPLLDRESTKGMPYRQYFVQHAMACMATGASAEVSF